MTQDLQTQKVLLTGARQTMMAWSKVIEAREEIPAIYKSHFEKYFGEGQPLPLVIWMPSLDRH